MFSRNLPCFNGSRSSPFPGVNMKLRISPLSLIIRCNLNPKNHPIEHLPRSASPSNVLLYLNHIFFLLKCKFLAKIIGHTINLCNFRLWKHSGNRLNVIIQRYKFNTFIAMFLIISEIYLFLYRTHVKYKKNGKLACKIELAESTKIVKRAIILTENYANESS